MVRADLERGLAAGAAGGVGVGAVLALVVNPLTAYAEALADGHGGHAHAHGGSALDAAAATSVGAGVLWGLLLGAAFGVAFYLLAPALPGRGAVRAYVLAGAGFWTASVVPWLVLPPAAPGVEWALGPDARLAVYAGAMVVGAASAAVAGLAYRRTRTHGRWPAVAAGLGPLALVAVAGALAPSLVAARPPADLLAAYRGVVVLGQLGLWLTVATGFVALRRATAGAGAAPSARGVEG